MGYDEFFMWPMACSLSTSRPVRYIVVANKQLLRDGAGAAVPLPELQQLTFDLCFGFPNLPWAAGLLTQGVLGVSQDPWPPVEDPLGPSPDWESAT